MSILCVCTHCVESCQPVYRDLQLCIYVENYFQITFHSSPFIIFMSLYKLNMTI